MRNTMFVVSRAKVFDGRDMQCREEDLTLTFPKQTENRDHDGGCCY